MTEREQKDESKLKLYHDEISKKLIDTENEHKRRLTEAEAKHKSQSDLIEQLQLKLVGMVTDKTQEMKGAMTK